VSDASYRRLTVWKKCMDLVLLAYRIAATLPAEERFGLANQLRRAAVSIPTNIAEGTGRLGVGEYAYFLSIARGSARELDVLFEIAEQLGYARDDAVGVARKLSEEVSRMLTSMLRKLSR
jgi:four helix bundle protein